MNDRDFLVSAIVTPCRSPIDPPLWLALADWLDEHEHDPDGHGNPSANLLRICASVLPPLLRHVHLSDQDDAAQRFLVSSMGSDLPWYWPLRDGYWSDPDADPPRWGWPGWRCQGRHGVGRLPGILAGMRWLEYHRVTIPDLARANCRAWLGAALLYSCGVLTVRQKEDVMNRTLRPHLLEGACPPVPLRSRNRLAGSRHVVEGLWGMGGGPSGRCAALMTLIEAEERLEWSEDGKSVRWFSRTIWRPQARQYGLACRSLHRRLVRDLWQVGTEKQADRLYRSWPSPSRR